MFKNIACVSAGGDQGVLNSFFNTWATADISKHLPFIYNLSSIAIYSYLPAFKQSVHTHTHTRKHTFAISASRVSSWVRVQPPHCPDSVAETSGCFHVWGGIKRIQGQFKGLCISVCAVGCWITRDRRNNTHPASRKDERLQLHLYTFCLI